MKRTGKILSVVAMYLYLGLSLAQAGTEPAAANKTVPAKAEEVQPILVGQTFPNASLKGIDGSAVETSTLLAGKPSVLIFYRGSW
jgi:cytochrome oxidase Cu insertion factor (SCO1/SenC/PrrC family)